MVLHDTDEILRQYEVEWDYTEYSLKLKEDLASMYEYAVVNRDSSVQKSALIHDRDLRGCDFKPGERVWLFDKTARKLKTKWRGPYVIVNKLGEQNAILRSDKPQSKHFTTHLSKLKRCKGEPLPSYVAWAEERKKQEGTRGRPNRSAVVESRGPEDFSVNEDPEEPSPVSDTQAAVFHSVIPTIVITSPLVPTVFDT